VREGDTERETHTHTFTVKMVSLRITYMIWTCECFSSMCCSFGFSSSRAPLNCPLHAATSAVYEELRARQLWTSSSRAPRTSPGTTCSALLLPFYVLPCWSNFLMGLVHLLCISLCLSLCLSLPLSLCLCLSLFLNCRFRQPHRRHQAPRPLRVCSHQERGAKEAEQSRNEDRASLAPHLTRRDTTPSGVRQVVWTCFSPVAVLSAGTETIRRLLQDESVFSPHWSRCCPVWALGSRCLTRSAARNSHTFRKRNAITGPPLSWSPGGHSHTRRVGRATIAQPAPVC